MSTLPARRFLAAVTMVAFIVATVDSMRDLGGPAPRPLAVGAVGIGALTMAGWFWLAGRIPEGQTAPHRNWEARRSRGVRAVFYLGISAVTAIGLSTMSNFPGWQEFSEADLTIDLLNVTEIGSVEEFGSRAGTNYEFMVTAEVGRQSNLRTVSQTVSSKKDPSSIPVSDLSLYVIYDPDDLDAGMIFTDDPDDDSSLMESPISSALPIMLAIAIGCFWIGEELYRLRDRRGRAYIVPLHKQSRGWRLALGWMSFMTVFLLWGLDFQNVHYGLPGFNNGLHQTEVYMFTSVAMIIWPFTVSTGVILRRWIEDPDQD